MSLKLPAVRRQDIQPEAMSSMKPGGRTLVVHCDSIEALVNGMEGYDRSASACPTLRPYPVTEWFLCKSSMPALRLRCMQVRSREKKHLWRCMRGPHPRTAAGAAGKSVHVSESLQISRTRT